MVAVAQAAQFMLKMAFLRPIIALMAKLSDYILIVWQK